MEDVLYCLHRTYHSISYFTHSPSAQKLIDSRDHIWSVSYFLPLAMSYTLSMPSKWGRKETGTGKRLICVLTKLSNYTHLGRAILHWLPFCFGIFMYVVSCPFKGKGHSLPLLFNKCKCWVRKRRGLFHNFSKKNKKR